MEKYQASPLNGKMSSITFNAVHYNGSHQARYKLKLQWDLSGIYLPPVDFLLLSLLVAIWKKKIFQNKRCKLKPSLLLCVNVLQINFVDSSPDLRSPFFRPEFCLASVAKRKLWNKMIYFLLIFFLSYHQLHIWSSYQVHIWIVNCRVFLNWSINYKETWK